MKILSIIVILIIGYTLGQTYSPGEMAGFINQGVSAIIDTLEPLWEKISDD
jgi:hypothetical protein